MRRKYRRNRAIEVRLDAEDCRGPPDDIAHHRRRIEACRCCRLTLFRFRLVYDDQTTYFGSSIGKAARKALKRLSLE